MYYSIGLACKNAKKLYNFVKTTFYAPETLS